MVIIEIQVMKPGSKTDFRKPRFRDLLKCKTWHRFRGHWRVVWVVWFPIYVCDKCGMNFHTDRSFFCRDVEVAELSDRGMVKKGVMPIDQQGVLREDWVTLEKELVK